MRATVLGAAGPTVSPLGLGCMGLSGGYGATPGTEAAIGLLDRALDLGVRLWDTSDAYGPGRNERLIGEALRRLGRDRVVVATKFGGVFDEATGRLLGVRGDAAHVRAACEASLRRLGTDRIDLYYQHLPDPAVPVKETVAAMAALVAEGKVAHLGLSNVTAAQLRAAHAVHPVAAVQSEWSLFARGAEKELVPACAELGIGFVPFAPLGRGALTGTVSPADLREDDVRRTYPWFDEANSARNRTPLASLAEVAGRHGASPARVALAWLLHRARSAGVTAVPIPGTRSAERLAENVSALELVLSEADLAELDSIADRVHGSRRPELPEELRPFMPDDHGEHAAR